MRTMMVFVVAVVVVEAEKEEGGGQTSSGARKSLGIKVYERGWSCDAWRKVVLTRMMGRVVYSCGPPDGTG
jgi:hypothetical protein